MKESIYILANRNFSTVFKCSQLTTKVKDLIEVEFEFTKKHYQGKEFLDNHQKFFTELFPYYLKARVDEIEEQEVIEIIQLFNEFHYFDDEISFEILKVDSSELNVVKNAIEVLGFYEFMEVNKMNFNY